MARDAELFVAVGKKKAGKTRATMEKYLFPAIRGNPPRRVLIFDTHDEYGEFGIKTLPADKIGLFALHPQVEMRRVLPYRPDGREMSSDEKVLVVQHILDYFYKGVVVFEDINEFIFDYMPGDVIGSILSQRHDGIDVILHYHGLDAIHKKVWRHIDNLRIHKCESTVVDNKDKFPGKFELFQLSENIVNNEFNKGKRFFNLEIRTGTQKIYAAIDEEARDKAIEDYLKFHGQKRIKLLTDSRDRTNNKLYNYSQAFDMERERIIETYFME